MDYLESNTPLGGEILVVMLTRETDNPEIQKNIIRLKQIFTTNPFIFCPLIPKNPDNPFVEALQYAKQQELPVLIIRDTSQTHLTTRQLAEQLTRCLTLSDLNRRKNVSGPDLFFLTSWGDQCQKMIDLDLEYLKISETPTADQAIFFPVPTIDLFLQMDPVKPFDVNQTIQDLNLVAAVFIPNLIFFNLNLAESNLDFLKSNGCYMAPNPTEQTGVTTVRLLYLVIIIVLILVFAWAILQIKPT